ncbi:MULTISPECIES: hypothetical protein [Streptomyces]|uniref:hypothetical protein n=1 Tax=Streptomyces TaxID=1883 RepID=UPI00192ECB64|nr:MULTISPECIES: hypothetical protein [Streptomyces]
MSRTPEPAHCVVHGSSCRQRPALPDALVIVVITVLACVLSASGWDLTSVLAVLGGAGAVATGTLTALNGQGPGRLLLRTVRAVTGP